MLKYTPAKIKKRTIKTVRSIRTVRATLDSDEFGTCQKITFKVLATTIPRKVTIKLYKPELIGKTLYQRPAWVHCDCEWFKFFCEVALAKRNSSAVINSNGKPPKETNPREWPYICKHLVAVLPKLQRAKFKMPRIRPTQDDIDFILKEVDRYIPGV